MGRKRTSPESFWARVRKGAEDACWPWTGRTDDGGYGLVSYADKSRRASHVAWLFTYGSWPRLQVLHSCDNPSCLNPKHLFEGTQLDNMRDRNAKGRAPDQRGEAGPGARLTARQVAEIRKKYKPRVVTLAMLAAQYGVHYVTIHDVIKRKTWT